MTPDSVDLSHIMQYCTTTKRTDINVTKPLSIVYGRRTDAGKYSSLPHLHDKPKIDQNCPNSIQVASCQHKCSKFAV
jgi:hypothetical protein